MLEQRIRNNFNVARKNKNELMRKTYESVIAKIMVAEKSGKYTLPLPNDVIEGLIQKEIKELKETAESFIQAKRYIDTGIVQFQIDELAQYLPKMLTEIEVEDMIADYITATNETNKGKVIGAIAKMVGSRFDKSKIAGLVAKVEVKFN